MKLTEFQQLAIEVIRLHGGSVHLARYPFGSYWVGANRVVLYVYPWPGKNTHTIRLSTLNALVAKRRLTFDRVTNVYYLVGLPALEFSGF